MTGRPLLVCAPLRIEARALRRGLPAGSVVRTGYGPKRTAAGAGRFAAVSGGGGPGAVAVAGFGGAVLGELRPGDLVVATELRTEYGFDGAGRAAGVPPAVVPCPSAPLLAHALRRRGHTVHCGPVAVVDHVVSGEERHRLARTGVLAVDMESAAVAAAMPGTPFAAVRVVVDTPAHPLVHPATPRRALQGLSTLARIGPALSEWAVAVGPRRVLLAGPRSFCAGVDRAIEIVERALALRGAPVYVRKQIVHNVHVVRDLEQRGAVFVEELEEVPDGATVVFSAHGVSPAVRSVARARDLDVVDATCPLVAKVHTEARRFAGRGDTVVLIGHAGHEETEGTMGEAPDRTLLVQSVEEAARLEVADPERVSYLMQTTLSVEESHTIVEALRQRFPAIEGPSSDDICYATSNRQHALVDADLVIVLGSANSSNSRRLVETAERLGTEAHLVDSVEDVDPRWLAGVRSMGLTAGASAPPHLVEEFVTALRGLGPVEAVERPVTTETIRFTLPKEVIS